MDESSENSSFTNQNLKEMIMEKLSAAREQKLKQNSSTSSLPVSKPVPVVQNTDEEKKLLMTMLEKSQASASQACQDRKALELKVSNLSQQIRVLSTENKELKNEIDKLASRNPKGKTEGMLLQELQKAENLVSDLQKKSRDEVNTLNEKISQLLETQETSAKNEVVKMEERINNLFEVIKEKDKEIENLKKKNLAPRQTVNERTLHQTLNEVRSEKEKIERNLERTLKMSCEKEAELSDEIIKLKTFLGQVRQQKDQKESELKAEINTLNQEIISMRQVLTEYKKKNNEDQSIFEAEKNELKMAYQMLQNDIKSSEAFSTFYLLKGDLHRAQETISTLESTIKNLKDSSFSTGPFPKPKNQELSDILSGLQKDFQDFYLESKSEDDRYSAELLQKNEEISSLLNEISELRHKIVLFENKKYENELVIVRADLHKAVAERAHAKRLIVSYIRSLQYLERILNERIDENSLGGSFKNEIDRLNEENKSVVEAKIKQEQFFELEIKNLQQVIDRLHERIMEVEMKLDSCQKLRNKENSDEMKSWIIRNKQLQELNKRLVEGFSLLEKAKEKPEISRKRNMNHKDSLKIL